jgi:Domain of unknown function (DUF4173)
MTKKAVSAAFVFILFYNLFLYDTSFGIGFGVLFLLFNLYNFITRSSNRDNTRTGTVFAVLGTVTAFLFSIRANEVVQAINLFNTLIFSGMAYYFFKLQESSQYSISEFLYAPFNTFKALFLGLKNTVLVTRKSQEDSVGNSKVPAIVRGLAITIPVVTVLLFVLYTADPVFAKITRDFMDTLFGRAAISLILFTFLFILYKSVITHTWGNDGLAHPGRKYEPLILNISVASILLVFMLIQIRYVFMYVSPDDLQQIGITSLTYSEYVRKGFFELLIAAAISCSAILYAIRSIHKLAPNDKKILQITATIVASETAFLLISASKRVLEYNAAHGMTRARIFGIIFLIWLFLALTIMVINIVKRIENYRVFMSVVGLFTIGLVSVNLINIDGLVATQFRPTVNKEVDYYYIADLSPDAFQSWDAIINDAQKTVTAIEKKPVSEVTSEDNRKLTWAQWSLSRLQHKTDSLRDKYGSLEELKVRYSQQDPYQKSVYDQLSKRRNWQSYNLSEWQAFQWMQANKVQLDKVSQLQNQIAAIQNQIPQNIKDNTNLDRSIDAPLM